ncbi:Holliday junction branch migration protein RuvA [Candidatus Wolfebacteria bacterium]|nr:Holliday junction branch migration protein RuvA [Candidatus Wolfebacteria bacterium]
MIHSISGKLIFKDSSHIVVEAAAVGYKIFVSQRAYKELPKNGSKIKIFCYYRIKQEEIPELYGFLTEKELEIFELLISISGVGPKSALNILGAVKLDKFLAAAQQGRADLISKSWGIGKKKAERIILELKGKIKKTKIYGDIKFLEADNDLKSALKNLGYRQKEIEHALGQISEKIRKTEERLKEALKFLNQK